MSKQDDSIVTTWDGDAEEFLPEEEDLDTVIERVLDQVDNGMDAQSSEDES